MTGGLIAMKKVWIFSALLIVGLGLSQVLPGLLGAHADLIEAGIGFLTMVGLAFIMIHVGYEFDLDKGNLRELGWDYVVAMTAATFPWLLVTGYALLMLMPPRAWATYDGWTEALLTSRFAAPTSAGILFSMLAAAGLSATWTFRKARILAIFDDLDTILLMVPLSMLIVGLAWQMGVTGVDHARVLVRRVAVAQSSGDPVHLAVGARLCRRDRLAQRVAPLGQSGHRQYSDPSSRCSCRPSRWAA